MSSLLTESILHVVNVSEWTIFSYKTNKANSKINLTHYINHLTVLLFY